jgi:hypothetical protein
MGVSLRHEWYLSRPHMTAILLKQNKSYTHCFQRRAVPVSKSYYQATCGSVCLFAHSVTGINAIDALACRPVTG